MKKLAIMTLALSTLSSCMPGNNNDFDPKTEEGRIALFCTGQIYDFYSLNNNEKTVLGHESRDVPYKLKWDDPKMEEKMEQIISHFKSSSENTFQTGTGLTIKSALMMDEKNELRSLAKTSASTFFKYCTDQFKAVGPVAEWTLVQANYAFMDEAANAQGVVDFTKLDKLDALILKNAAFSCNRGNKDMCDAYVPRLKKWCLEKPNSLPEECTWVKNK